MTRKILFALTSHDRKGDTGQATGFFLAEAAHPWKVLTDAGFAVEFASTEGGGVPMDGVDLDDPVNKAFLDDPEVAEVLEATPKLADVDPSRYEAVLMVGGHGTMWDFPDDAGLQRVSRDVYEAGGVVAAVCHGPAGLVNLRLSDGRYLVDGKRLAAFTDDEERAVKLDGVVPFLLATRLVERGAKHEAAPDWQSKVVVDGRLVTGQNPASAEGVGQEIARLLKDRRARNAA